MYFFLLENGRIISLSKVTHLTSMSQYRPISIFPYLFKVLKHIVHVQLLAHIAKNILLYHYQSAYRPRHSTITSLICVTNNICLAMDSGQLTIIVHLDLSNAFNLQLIMSIEN